MRARLLVSFAAFAGVASVIAIAVAPLGACSDAPQPALCDDIPDGGCPLSHGVACIDPSCAAVYACNAGVWSLDHVCPHQDAAIVGDAAVDARPSLVRDASFDVPPGASGGPGCADLQPPDCSLGFALACPADQCCDCEDLFVCADGGWGLWGSCDGDGGLDPR
jgi:hypothetical protein